jgi:transposase
LDGFSEVSRLVDVRFVLKAPRSGPSPKRCICPEAPSRHSAGERPSRDPIRFSPYLYPARNRVERFFNRSGQRRRMATRYDELMVAHH